MNNPGSSTLGGTTTVTVSGGVATFTNLSLNIVDTGYTLQATSGTLTPVTTSPIAVTPAAANQLVILDAGQPPASVPAGQTFPMSVVAEDQFGNVDTNFTGAITLSLANSSTAVFVGNPSLTVSAVNGVAAFPSTSLAIDTAGSYQIAATNLHHWARPRRTP